MNGVIWRTFFHPKADQCQLERIVVGSVVLILAFWHVPVFRGHVGFRSWRSDDLGVQLLQVERAQVQRFDERLATQVDLWKSWQCLVVIHNLKRFRDDDDDDADINRHWFVEVKTSVSAVDSYSGSIDSSLEYAGETNGWYATPASDCHWWISAGAPYVKKKPGERNRNGWFYDFFVIFS